ncbi:MAG: hypothetical protein MZV70_05315 [Desulfobacterales bacterium]|nr:hypothetical protein [Desulfobacterales bacterium]
MKVADILEPGVEGVPENIRKALTDGRVRIQERAVRETQRQRRGCRDYRHGG